MNAITLHPTEVPARGRGGDSTEPVQIPPHDIDAEAAVISCAFVDETCVGRVEFLRPEHFYAESHRRIWEAILAVHAEPSESGETSCIVRVGSRLKASGRIAQVGGMPYLTEIINAAPAVANVVKYAVIIFDRWRVRQAIATAQLITAKGYLGVEDVQDFCERGTKAIARIADQNPLRPVESNDEALRRIVESANPEARSASTNSKASWGYPTGLYSVDVAMCGLMPQHKTTIAADTGGGKTAIAVQIAVKLAKDGVGVLFFSTEQKRGELLRRAVASESNVDNEKIKRGTLSKEEFGAVNDAAMRLRKLPLRIDDRSVITIEEVRAAALAYAERARLLSRVPLGLVVLDYVQNLAVRGSLEQAKEHEQITHSTKGFKRMLQELNVAGIELAQMKPIERGKKPTKDSVAGSRSVAKSADELVYLVTDEEHDTHRDVQMIFSKQRDGKEGAIVSLEFFGSVFRFEDPRDPMRPASRDYLMGVAPRQERGTFDDMVQDNARNGDD